VSAKLTADFSGVVVLVTGAASGIGAAIAKRFIEAHATVCGCDISAESTGPEGVATWGKVDVSSDASISSYVSKVAAEHGRIDVLVNAAGVGVQGNTFAPTHEVSTDGWQKVIDVNLTGAFLASRAALPELIKAKGSVVHVASIMSYVNAPGTVAYGSAKAGLLGLTRVMALEYAKQGVRVNSVCPGFVDTPMVRRHLEQSGDPAKELAALNSLHPIGRIGRPSEIADAVFWLASASASFVTGIGLQVDGGYAAQ
jgi:NAD(P)-dependent dehydrogenase (short-subunit alcohol dehydrogenase family)